MKSNESPEALVRRVFQQVLQGREAEAVDELFSDDYFPNDLSFGHPERPSVYSHERMKAAVTAPTPFTDARMEIEQLVVDGAKVWTLWRAEGTHEKEMTTQRFGIIPPTGRRVVWKGITIYEVREGKVCRSWTLADSLGMFEQLGVVPSRRHEH